MHRVDVEVWLGSSSTRSQVLTYPGRGIVTENNVIVPGCCNKPGGFKTISHSSGDLESEIELAAASVPLEAGREEPAHGSLRLGFCWLQGILGVSWISDVSRHSRSHFPIAFCPLGYPGSPPPLQEDTSHWVQGPL